ncbi:MAG TPA: hypothetical protein VMT87_05460 [Vicinamibacteria bacterium]|nr:hypothetical protein [Vicinamibacteria bacterium]
MTLLRARAVWRPALVGVAYLGLSVLATWPLARDAADHVYGQGTPPLNVWAMAHVRHALPRHPLSLFDGNAFHPYRDSLAFSEHLFVPALLSAPAALLTGNDVLAHNVAALLSLALAGLGMYLLARELIGDTLASFGAGVLYAFHTWNINELVRLQILSNQWFPFLLLALVRFFRTGRPGWGWAAGLFYALQSLSCMYWALYAPFAAVPLLALLYHGHRAERPPLRPLLLGLGLAAALTALFFIPYVRTARAFAFTRSMPEPVALDRYLDVLHGNRLYEPWLGSSERTNADAAHFLGFVPVVLGLVGALAARGRWPAFDRVRPLLVVFVAAGVVLSAGPVLRAGPWTLEPAPYAFLHRFVPGFDGVRYPERFALFVVLGLAPLAAAGLARVRLRVGTGAAAALVALTFVEHFSAPLPLVPLPAGEQIPSVYRWLADQDDVRVVAEVPEPQYFLDRAGALPMYFSTAHWKRTVQGFTGYFPPAYRFARWRLFQFPAPETVAFLERFGVDAVVVRPDFKVPLPVSDRWRVVGPFAEGHRVLRLSRARGLRLSVPDTAHPGLREIPREGWRLGASVPGARRAVDGDPDTSWTTHDDASLGDFYRVELAEPAAVARISIAIGSPYEFPTRIRLIGEPVLGPPREIEWDAGPAYERLLDWLVHRPREARLDIDIEPRPLRAVRLRVKEPDPFLMPWRIGEIRLYAPAGSGD